MTNRKRLINSITIDYVIRSNHPKFRYCIINSRNQLVSHIDKISDAKRYYRNEIKLGIIEMRRDLTKTYDCNQRKVI